MGGLPNLSIPARCASARWRVCLMTLIAGTWMAVALSSMSVSAGGFQATTLPFGVVDTPLNNTTGVTGAVPFTGWALDDVGVAAVTVCRAAVVGETAPADPQCAGAAQIFIGTAVFIEGARPDVNAAFPTFPQSSRAGWGFMVLTNMLPDVGRGLPTGGNGTFAFFIYARDIEGHFALLGTRTMTCDNEHATLPFGTIDTPEQGGVASGAEFVNFGWVLTPDPKFVPFDGSTITIYVDGLPVGTASYNHFRPDIAGFFPGLANSNGAVGFFILDTTTLANGLHTIAWGVSDSDGAVAGIGSRYFRVSNGPNQAPVAHAGANQTVAPGATVQLSGSGSSDPDGDPLTYSWSFTSRPAGSAAFLSNPSVVNPTFVADLPGPYVVQLIVNDGQVDSAPAAVTITATSPGVTHGCGDLISGVITAGAQVDQYTFHGQAGQLVTLTVASTGGFSSVSGSSTSARMTLLAPSGPIVGTLLSNNQANFVLPESGTYVIRVNANNFSTTGSYNVGLECLFPAQSPGTVTLACGSLSGGVVGAAAQVDLYRFEGQAGQLVTLTLASTGGFSSVSGSSTSVRLTLFAPSNVNVGTLLSNNQSNFVLPVSGTYVIRVNANNFATTGSYNVGLECLFPVQSPGTVMLACGSLSAGVVGSAAQADLYRFDGQAGQLVTLTLASTGGFSSVSGSSTSARLTLFAASGSSVGTLLSNNQSNFVLPVSGTYVIRVNANNFATTGSYNVGLECLFPVQSPGTVMLACGSLSAGVVGSAAQADLYRFDGQAGQLVTLTLASTGGFSSVSGSSTSARQTLFAPSGVSVGTLLSNSQANFVLPETGTYVIRVNANNFSTTGSYNIGLECLS